jgi:hypothetical protein
MFRFKLTRALHARLRFSGSVFRARLVDLISAGSW